MIPFLLASLATGIPICNKEKSDRGYDVELWQEAAPQATKHNDEQFSKFMMEMIQFACEKQLDRVFVTVQDPSQWPSGTVDLYTKILTVAPEWMEVGFLLNVNPKYPWQWKPLSKAGVDTSLLQAMTFVKEVNDGAAAQGAKPVTILGGDGENNGLNANNFCDWRDVGFDVLGESAGDLKFLQAKQGSLNGPALFEAAKELYEAKGGDPARCGTVDNYLARPELYWYMDELKQQGCIGCPAHTPLTYNKPEQCTRSTKESCSAIPACAAFSTFFTNGDLYDQCIAQADTGCPEDCCKCYGCVPCGYDEEGNVPNPRIFYQTHRTDPAAMAAAIWNGVKKGHLNDTISLPNTAPMLSIEMSHNLYADAVQAAGPNTSPDTCMARHFAGDGDEICGTFDGLGAMTYDDLLSTFAALHESQGWKTFTIYEWAFVPQSWISKPQPVLV
jgi:hypothetical protein